jgi:hypothetical protein
VRNSFSMVHLAIVLAALAPSAFCSIARYNECRTDHPWWYCIDSK